MKFWEQMTRTKKILSTATVAVGLLGGIYKLYREVQLGAGSSKIVKAQELRNYSGTVRDAASGLAVPNAKVVVAADQATPQVQYADTDGNFYVRLPTNTGSLRLIITASGYEPFTRDAQISRTGPEDIRLVRLQVRAPSRNQGAGVSKRGVSPASPGSPATASLERTPGSIVNQTCSTGPCIGQVGGDVNIYGDPKPGPRDVAQQNGDAAVKLLQLAGANSAGSKWRMRLDIVGASQEIDHFTQQVLGIFSEGGWRIEGGERSSFLTSTYDDGTTREVEHGEGIRCFPADTLPAKLAMRALGVAGYPCAGSFMPSDTERIPGDFYVQIGPNQ